MMLFNHVNAMSEAPTSDGDDPISKSNHSWHHNEEHHKKAPYLRSGIVDVQLPEWTMGSQRSVSLKWPPTFLQISSHDHDFP